MKILVLAQNIGEGGGRTHLESLIASSDNHDWIVISRLNIKAKAELIKSPKSFIGKWFNLIFKSVNYIRRYSPDVVLVPGGIYPGKKLNTPIISMCQNMLPWDKGYQAYNTFYYRLIRCLQKLTFQRSDGVIFLTRYAYDTVNALTDLKSSKIIPHGIDNVEFESIDVVPKRVIYVSRFEPYKNQIELLDVIESNKELHQFEFLLIGQASNEQYSRRIFQHNAVTSGKAKVLCDLTRQETLKQVASSEKCLFLSHVENLPFILLEYLSLQKPTAILPKRPMIDIHSSLFKLNSQDYSQTILEFLTSNYCSDSLNEISLEIHNKYSWKRTCIETLRYFESCAQ